MPLTSAYLPVTSLLPPQGPSAVLDSTSSSGTVMPLDVELMALLPLVLVRTYRKLRELGHRTVEYDIGGLRHRDRDQTPGRIADPERAIAAIPTVPAWNRRHVVGRRDDRHTVAQPWPSRIGPPPAI